ncbi:glycosyltransferase 61 family protein, partial [Rhodoblastus sp.]|uniref:glycosyltransferase 61 family protein n=1 Tax=Rhodoblastus sp. TaxID=1962975 RepID=UPI0035AF74E9
RDSLGLFGVAPDRIVVLGAAPVFLQRSVYPFADAAPSRDALEVLESFPLRLPASADAPKRIFVAPVLPAALRDSGFSALDPAAMSFAQRVQAFARAEIVVGPAGAHLANAVFAPRGVRVMALTVAGDELSPLRAVIALKQGRLKTLDPDQSARLPAALDEWIA